MIAFVVLATACAAPGQTRSSVTPKAQKSQQGADLVLWRFSELARTDQQAVLLRSSQGLHGSIETAFARRLVDIASRVFAGAGEAPRPDFALLASTGVNAFAFYADDKATIAISQGMLGLLGMDDDVWAALLGHELAHLRLDHIGKQIDRQHRSETLSSVAGAMLSAIGLPFASLATDATATLAKRAYGRDDEREADQVGMEYMRRAGFDPEGAVRLQQHLLRAERTGTLPFLSTHPGGEERIENLRRLIQANH